PPPIGAELDTLDRSRELPLLDLGAGLHVPETHGVVGRARGDEDGVGGHVDGPDGA
ncbi:hypothetical protein KEM55_008991, partial [Ascosphaera atra]